jgi:hypothetical protein
MMYTLTIYFVKSDGDHNSKSFENLSIDDVYDLTEEFIDDENVENISFHKGPLF